MTVAEWLNNNAESIGIDIQSNEALKKITTATATLELPAEFEGKFLTRKAAENDPLLKSHYFAQAYNGIDSTLKQTLTDLGLDTEAMNSLLQEKATGKNVAAALKKIQELEAAKVGSNKGEKAELQNEINALKANLAAANTAKEAEITQLKAQFENELVGFQIDNTLSSYNYGDRPEDKSKGVVLAKHFLNSAIQEKGLKIVKTDSGIVLKTKDNTDYYENNKLVSFKDLADGIMASNKLIAITDPKNTGGTPQKPGAPAQQTIPSNEDPLKAAGHSSFQKAREDFRSATETATV